jgi:hypothetical protein
MKSSNSQTHQSNEVLDDQQENTEDSSGCLEATKPHYSVNRKRQSKPSCG